MDSPIYLGPMFVGHARFKPGKKWHMGCSKCSFREPADGCGWLYCPTCGGNLVHKDELTQTIRPDPAELVQLRKNVRLTFNHYAAEPPPGGEVAEHYWLPAPGLCEASLYLDVAAGETKFAADVGAVDHHAAMLAFEQRFKEQLAELAKAYQTSLTRWGLFCWF